MALKVNKNTPKGRAPKKPLSQKPKLTKRRQPVSETKENNSWLSFGSKSKEQPKNRLLRKRDFMEEIAVNDEVIIDEGINEEGIYNEVSVTEQKSLNKKRPSLTEQFAKGNKNLKQTQNTSKERKTKYNVDEIVTVKRQNNSARVLNKNNSIQNPQVRGTQLKDNNEREKGQGLKRTKHNIKSKSSLTGNNLNKNKDSMLNKVFGFFGKKKEKISEDVIKNLSTSEIIGQSKHAYTDEFMQFTDYPKVDTYVDIDNMPSPEQFIKEFTENERKRNESSVSTELDFGEDSNKVEETLTLEDDSFEVISGTVEELNIEDNDEIKLDTEYIGDEMTEERISEDELQLSSSEDEEQLSLTEDEEQLSLIEDKEEIFIIEDKDDLIIPEEELNAIEEILSFEEEELSIEDKTAGQSDLNDDNEEIIIENEQELSDVEDTIESQIIDEELSSEDNIEERSENSIDADEFLLVDEDINIDVENNEFLVDVENTVIPTEVLHKLKEDSSIDDTKVENSIQIENKEEEVEESLVLGKVIEEDVKPVDVNPRKIGLTFNLDDMKPESRESVVNKTFLETSEEEIREDDSDILKSINSNNKEELVKGSTSIAEALQHLR